MKDSYTFDMDAHGLDIAYQKHHDAYCRIFDRCGLKYTAVEAHSGAMGGSQSEGGKGGRLVIAAEHHGHAIGGASADNCLGGVFEGGVLEVAVGIDEFELHWTAAGSISILT